MVTATDAGVNGDGKRVGRIPAYRRIAADLREQIQSSLLKPGEALPAERALAQLYSVSLMTARQAVIALQHEGLVERLRGVGTFVSPPRIHFNRLDGLGAIFRAMGLSGKSRLIDSGSCQEPAVAARLGRAPGVHLLRFERLHLAGDDPFALIVGYLPLALFPRFPVERLEKESLFTLLETDYGMRAAYADEEIAAAGAEGAQTALLQVDMGAPLLHIRQLICTKEARRLIYLEGWYRADRHSVSIRRYR